MRDHTFVVLADRRDRRVALYQQALERFGATRFCVVDYRQLISNPDRLTQAASGPSVIRIESPGRDPEVCRALLSRGAQAALNQGAAFIEPERLARLPLDKGRILYPRQWYLGFCAVLGDIESQLAGCSDVVLTSQPRDIASLFDKRRCNALFARAGAPVPQALPHVTCFDELRSEMHRHGLPRVFIKLNNGSSAFGVGAYETSRGRQQLRTTVEMVRSAGQTILYNSRRLQRYANPSDIAALIDALCEHDVHAEAWIPKAGLDGHTIDLRVVTIRQEPRHAVVRMSKGPITNLHLLNRRADPSALRSRMDPDAWNSLLNSCRTVASQFPDTLHVGVDVAVGPRLAKHAVIEANAFGDLLHDVTDRNMTTHEAEVAALAADWSKRYAAGNPV
ncbi:MAG: STM4014 family protein [Phycisphaerae bacterium]|nr:STM4014 family protein [Phycisphaerae bacterium]MDP7286549.1 STM4014 family protein [Phycisphaerae bacterium]